VVHTGAYPEGEGQAIFHSKYHSDRSLLAAKIARDLKSWGFLTAGYHSPRELAEHLPTLVDSYPAKIAYWMGRPEYPDVFDPLYAQGVAEQFQQSFGPYQNHSNLMGC
jgi:hypothetical protein